jgi:hypothetical protein
MTSMSIKAGLACLLLATPLVAQERQVARRQYTFLDNSLTIDVLSEASGVLRVLRGEPGMVEVAARAPKGFPAFAMGGRDGHDLRLTAMGADRVDYLVVVPEDVRVRIRLPDRRQVEIASSRPAATYTWGANPPPVSGEARTLAVPPSGGMYLSYYSESVPRVFSIRDVAGVQRLDVQFEGNDFRVSTSRPVTMDAGRSDAIDFRAGQPPLNLVLSLPTDAADFRLVIGGKTALEARAGDVRTFCGQFISQRTQDGRRLYTFIASGDRLICQ